MSGLSLSAPTVDVAMAAAGIQQGATRVVSRVLTWLENRDARGRAVLDRLASRSPAMVIGITGFPGTGKSTLIDGLIALYRRQGCKVAILAVDASSPITGGALLGDRIRMQGHATDPGVFIRSLGHRGHPGGIAPAMREAVQVLSSAGYDPILIETVGMGQSDVAIRDLAPIVVAVVAPGLGDEVQAMKAGLLEVADVVVVNKADRADADRTCVELRPWCRTVLTTEAVSGKGLPLLAEAIQRHRVGAPPAHRCAEEGER